MARVSKRLRYEILRRDGFRCRYCGVTPAEAELRVDHVVPEALGGLSEPSNLATACDPCNSGKSSVPPEAPVVEQVADDALRWSAAMERAAADMEAELRERDDQNKVFLDEWGDYTYGFGKASFPLDPAWSASVTRLRSAGLTDALIVEAVQATMAANKVQPENRFRYFCGVAWNMVSKLQEAAEKIASGPDNGDEQELFPDRSRDQIAASLDFHRAVAEYLLGWLPPWLLKQADEFTRRQLEEDGDVDSPYEERLAFMVLHAAISLKNCQIQPSEKGGE